MTSEPLVVWLAWRENGGYEGSDLVAVTSTEELARVACARAAAPLRQFLAPPTRPVQLTWRTCRFPEDADDPDEQRGYTRWADGPAWQSWRIERHEVQ